MLLNSHWPNCNYCNSIDRNHMAHPRDETDNSILYNYYSANSSHSDPGHWDWEEAAKYQPGDVGKSHQTPSTHTRRMKKLRRMSPGASNVRMTSTSFLSTESRVVVKDDIPFPQVPLSRPPSLPTGTETPPVLASSPTSQTGVMSTSTP